MAIPSAWPECRVHTTWLSEDKCEVPEHDFSLILLGIGAEHGRVWVQGAIEGVRARQTDTPIIIMCDYASPAAVAMAREVGAQGLVTFESMTLAVAISVLRLVHAGGTYLPVLPQRVEREAPDSLGSDAPSTDIKVSHGMFTTREVDILRKIAEGKPNKIIAYELKIAESTTKIHIRHIMRKTGLTNRTQVALAARDLLNHEADFTH